MDLKMKNLFSLLLLSLLCVGLYAQTPQAINYQGLARDNAGNILANQNVSLKLSILAENITGTAVYVETHTTTTDANGLFALLIGQGTVVSGTFNAIDWGSSPHYLKVEIDPLGGSSYTHIGTNQFTSVPYSLHSSNGMPSGQNAGDILYWDGAAWVQIPVGTNGQVLTLNNGVPVWGGIQAPILNTTGISEITNLSATASGIITGDGGTPVTTRGICYSTSPNPTTTSFNIECGNGTGSFTAYFTGLTANTTYYVRAYAINSLDTFYGSQLIFTTVPVLCGPTSISVNHNVSGGVAPVAKTVTYSVVTNIPGELSKCWITQNLGSDHQATSVDNATEASAGWYWQFNRKQGFKHDGTTRTPNTAWITSISENSDWLPANDPCALELGSGWRLPTSTEWTNVDASGSWTNWNGPWNSILKLHAAGYLSNSGGSLYYRGSEGYYWSSVQGDATDVWNLHFSSGYSGMLPDSKANGFSVRCLRD
jgi:hypothetical protein